MQHMSSKRQKCATTTTAGLPQMAARPSRNYRLAGFTLIELMIVVAIVAILAAIAVPSYLNYVRQSRRASAKTALLDLASREEKWYAVQNRYDATLTDLGYASAQVSGSPEAIQVPNNTNEDYYSVSVSVTPASAATAAGFIATAVPQGDQTKDTCGSYTLTNLGVQGNSTSSNGCW